MNHKRFFAWVLVPTLCMTALCGCRRRGDTVTDPTGQPSATPTVQEDVMGLISYVGDSAVALSVYTTEKDLTDLRNIGPEDWTPTDTTRYVTVNDQTEYYHARGDALIQIPRADLAVGDFILVRTADGVLQIIRIPSAEGEPSAGAVENEAVPTAIPDPAALTAEEG